MLQYYFYFIIYSFLGWCMESSIFSYKEKRFVNRGFLNGPLCPVYGTGMVIIIFLLRPFHGNAFLLFFCGAVLASILEYITGFLLEKLFYTRWWDYTHKKFNIHGYVCLENTLEWGVLCVIMINIVQPIVNRILASFNETFLYSFAGITFIILIVDIIVTVSNLLGLKQYISSLHLVHNHVKESEILHNAYESLQKRLRERYITINEFIKEIKSLKDFREAELESIDNYLDKLDRKSLLPRKQIKRLYRNYKTKDAKGKYSNESKIVKEDIEKK